MPSVTATPIIHPAGLVWWMGGWMDTVERTVKLSRGGTLRLCLLVP